MEILKQISANGFQARGAGSATGMSYSSTLLSVAGCISRVRYDPYPTTQSGDVENSQFLMGTPTFPLAVCGKEWSGAAGQRKMYRRRIGASFILGTYGAGATFTLTIQGYYRSDFDGLFSGQAYLSNSDDAPLYITGTKTVWDWEDNLDNNLGKFATNAFGQFITANINIPYAMISPRFNSIASFVFSSDREFSGSGNTAETQNPQVSSLLYSGIDTHARYVSLKVS